ncbi:MAG: ROK family protein, partial [Actinomycetota bacterium]
MNITGASTGTTGSIATLDVGGTSIKAGAVAVAGPTDAQVVLCDARPAHADGDRATIIGQLTASVQAALDIVGPSPIGVAIGFPGPFDLEAGTALIHGLFKYESIYGVDLRAALRTDVPELTDLPIRFVHDNEAAGVGEALFGAGRGYRRVLTVTLGTGVGACLTDAGNVIQWVDDLEVEKLARRPTPEGRADDVLSARGLAARYEIERELLADHLAPRPLTSELAAIARDHGTAVGRFLRPAVDELRLDAVVIGGGLAAAYDLFGAEIEAELPIPCSVEALGATGPMLGAAH